MFRSYTVTGSDVTTTVENNSKDQGKKVGGNSRVRINSPETQQSKYKI